MGVLNSIKTNKYTDGLIFALLSIFFALVISASLIAPTSYAAAAPKHAKDYAKSATLYSSFLKCVTDERGNQARGAAGPVDNSWFSEEDAKTGNWWHESTGAFGWAAYRSPSYLTAGEDDGRLTCNKILKQGLAVWGFSDAQQILCDAEILRTNGASCKNGSGDFDIGRDDADAISKAIESKAFGGSKPILKGEHRYLIYLAAFKTGCKAVADSTGVDKRDYRDIKIVDDKTGKITPTRFEGEDKHARKVWVYTQMDGKEVGKSNCEFISGKVSEYAKDYSNWVSKNQDIAQAQPVFDDADNTVVDETNCVLDGIGWIVCPIVSAGAIATDALYGWISNFLVTQPLNMDTGSSENTTYIAWKIMRNVANVAFVIAFLVIIFSQITGSGISNYGVKKMLPRLVIAAILVNLSYWITAIAVDLSNIIGNNVFNVLRNLPLGDITPQDNLAETITGWILGGGAALALGIWAVPIAISAAGTLGMALLWAVAVIVLIAGLSLLIAFLVMALRQAMIIILIIISPLAFVAYLLPNTEKYFNLWRKSLTTLLVFYPLFSLLFGGAYVASMVIIGSAGQQNSEAAVGMLVVVGMAVQFIPMFLTPLLIKFSSGVVGQVAGMVNNKNKGLIDRAKNARNSNFKLGMREALAKPGGRKNPFRAAYRGFQNKKRSDSSREAAIKMVDDQEYANTIINPASRAAKRAGGVHEHGAVIASANAQAVLDEADIKVRKAASVPLQAEITKIKAEGGSVDDFLLDQMTSASSSVTRSAASHIAASLGRSKILRQVKETGTIEDKQMIESAVSANVSALVGKAPDLVKGSSAAFNSMSGKTLAGLSGDTAKSYINHLESLHAAGLAAGPGSDEAKAFNQAMSAFSNSVEDIRRDPSLQASFGNDVGQEILGAFTSSSSAGFSVYSPSSINADGKIR